MDTQNQHEIEELSKLYESYVGQESNGAIKGVIRALFGIRNKRGEIKMDQITNIDHNVNNGILVVLTGIVVSDQKYLLMRGGKQSRSFLAKTPSTLQAGCRQVGYSRQEGQTRAR